MLRFLISLFFIGTFSGIYPQTTSIDSIRFAEMRSQLKEAKVVSFNSLDSAFEVLNNLKSDFQNSGDQDLWTEFLLMKAFFYLASEDHDSIIDLLSPVVNDFDRITLSNRASAYQHIGHAYKVAWVPDSALVNYIRALRLYEKADNQHGLSLSYLALGLTYSKLENQEMASYFYDKSIEYSTNSKVIEMHKKHITDQVVRPVSFDQTLALSLDIAKIAEEQGNKRLLMVAYSDLKAHYFDLNNFDKALEYGLKELDLIDATNADALLPNTNVFIASIYKLQNKPDKAIQKFKEALPSATDSLRLNIYQSLKEIHIEKGNFNAALDALENYSMLKDSITKRNAEASIANIMGQFKTELQEEQIKSLSYENELSKAKITSQRTTLFGTIGVSLLLFVLGYLGYRNYKTRLELDRTQLNFKLLQTQMNPHFMFNALNEIKLKLKNSDENNTKQNLTAYSKMMRQVLESSNKEFIPLKMDIEFIKNYLEMQQLVYQNSFEYKIIVHPDLDANYCIMPPMLTQPIVENAIIHGIKGVDNGEIYIDYHGSKEAVHIIISDNGVGINSEKKTPVKENHESIATSNIRQRIATYEKLHNFKIQLKIESENDKGTKVSISFPYRLKSR